MNRSRSYYRKQRRRSIHRKERILRQIGGESYVDSWAGNARGRFSKGKIHCSCPMCRLKSYENPTLREIRAKTKAAEQLREVYHEQS